MLAPATTQMLEDHGYVTENDEGWRKDWAFMEGHDELVTLELPNLVGDGLHLEECITMMMDSDNQEILHPLKNIIIWIKSAAAHQRSEPIKLF